MTEKQLKLVAKSLSDAHRASLKSAETHPRWDIRLKAQGRAAAYARALRLVKGMI